MPAGMSKLTGAKTDRQVQLVALGLGAETHADQVQLLLEALAHAHHHVVDQLAHGAAHGVGFARFVGRHEAQVGAVGGDLDQRVGGQLQLAAAALDGDLLVTDLDIHASRDTPIFAIRDI
jgi:hypothetical protein